MLKIILSFSIVFFVNALEVPRLTGPVVDKANLLSHAEKRAIAGKLRGIHANGAGPQIQVLIIPSLQGEVLENYSIKVVDQWKLGNEKRDDGLLFLIALRDRKMRIEVGQGLEGEITDYLAFTIINNVKPYFKKKAYYRGISSAISDIVTGINGGVVKETRQARRVRKKKSDSGMLLIFIIIWFLIMIFSKRARRGTYYGGLSGSSYRGGSGGFSGGGWSGGGGGFSGGGSSGGW